MRPSSHTTFVSSRSLQRRRARTQKIASFVVVGFLVAVFPIYPASGDFLYSRTGGVFQGNIDESTILGEGENFDASFDVSESGFIDMNVAIEQNRDWSARGSDIFVYTVLSGDTIGGLAEDFGLEQSTIKSNNAISKNILRVGQELVVLPEDGLLHTVEKGDGITKLAQMYQIEESEILRANGFDSVVDLQVDQKIILPGAKPISIPGAYSDENARCYGSGGAQKCSVNGSYQLTKIAPGGRGFVWGHCTYYVAQHWPTNWRGHARYWFENAKKAGYPTGQIARPGSIVVFYGPGYNLAYGHVGIVTQVQGETMIIKDMNYTGLNIVTTRKESIHNRYIIGYIYQK